MFGTGLSSSQQQVFLEAEQRWEEIITGDLPDYYLAGYGLIDDLRIDASAVAIDGADGILGQAGPDVLRPGSFLPVHGMMQFDTADLAAMEADGTLFDVVLHEMAHVLGYGTVWADLGLLQGGGTDDPRFMGPQATLEYNTLFGVSEAGVPVENLGGDGTANSHWRETVFGDEALTGFLSGTTHPLSRVSIAQFADLGYQVDLNQADAFVPAPISSFTPSPTSRHIRALHELSATLLAALKEI